MMKAWKKTGLETPVLYLGQTGKGIAFQYKFEVNKEMNGLILGTLGKGTHCKTFKKEEFKKELAPARAKIEEVNIGEQDYIRMIY